MESLQIENINDKIFTIRGLKVMLDSDLAKLRCIRITIT